MKKINTIIIPIIRPDFIGRLLETLAQNTEDNYYVIVIDQTTDNTAYLENHFKTHLWIRSYRNLGYAKAMNTGIKLAQTPYVTLCNDDLEFVDKRWWDGIIETFQTDHHIIAVNPMSPKEGAWGYGLREDNKDTWIPPEGYVLSADDPKSIVPAFMNRPLELKHMNEEQYTWLLNSHPRYRKETMVDGIAMWCTIFKKTGLEKIGLLDEKFYPGGGEDYDMLARAYSCAYPQERDVCDNEYHWRMVSTSRSWVWHHWGQSKDQISAKVPSDQLFASRPRWNNNDELWTEGFDVWGHKNTDGKKTPYKRTASICIDQL